MPPRSYSGAKAQTQELLHKRVDLSTDQKATLVWGLDLKVRFMTKEIDAKQYAAERMSVLKAMQDMDIAIGKGNETKHSSANTASRIGQGSVASHRPFAWVPYISFNGRVPRVVIPDDAGTNAAGHRMGRRGKYVMLMSDNHLRMYGFHRSSWSAGAITVRKGRCGKKGPQKETYAYLVSPGGMQTPITAKSTGRIAVLAYNAANKGVLNTVQSVSLGGAGGAAVRIIVFRTGGGFAYNPAPLGQDEYIATRGGRYAIGKRSAGKHTTTSSRGNTSAIAAAALEKSKNAGRYEAPGGSNQGNF